MMGPVLHFRGLEGRRWRLAALVATDDGDDPPPPLTTDEGDRPAVAPRRLARRGREGLWRYDFGLVMAEAAGRGAAYRIGGRRWCVRLPPAAGGEPLRFAYTACNGSEAEGLGSEPPPERNGRWAHLAAAHERAPFHLLLQGGDQLYADAAWDEIPALAAWRRLPARRRLAAPFPPELAEAVAAYYFARYRRLWSHDEVAPLLAAVPSLMMWDDHDIFDGWGSHDPEWQACPVFEGVGAAAREHFALFQLGLGPDERLPAGFVDPTAGHFGFAHRLPGGVGVIAPDLRSERTRRRVMGEAGWRDLASMLDGMAGCRHVLLMLSVPLVNASLAWLERLFEWLPGHQLSELDLRDQWQGVAHRDEWRRLVRLLAAFSARTGARVTVLSGEIHLGAFGVVEGGAGAGGVRVYQLTSSGIAHPPPPAPLVWALDRLAARAIDLGDGLTARPLPLPGSGGRRYLRERNWLTVEVPAAGRDLHATWHGDASTLTVRLPTAPGGRAARAGAAPAPKPAARCDAGSS